MTIFELNQLKYLNKEIEGDRERLALLRAKATAAGVSKLDGMPHGSTAGDPFGNLMAAIVDLEARIIKKQTRLIEEETRLTEYIETITDSYTRQIFTARFIRGLSWSRVAAVIIAEVIR